MMHYDSKSTWCLVSNKIASQVSSSSSSISSTIEVGNSYRIISIKLLKDFVKQFRCLNCQKKALILEESPEHKVGFFSLLICKCTECEAEIFIPTSPMEDNTASMVYEINMKSVAASSSLGLGMEGMQIFCYIMDLPDQ